RKRPPGKPSSSSSSAAVKRRRRGGVSGHLVDDAVCISGEEEDENEEEGSAAAGAVSPQEQQLHGSGTCITSSSRTEITNLMESADHLIPFADFIRLVKKMTHFHSREVSRWKPEALLTLHEGAKSYLLDVFNIMNQLAKVVSKLSLNEHFLLAFVALVLQKRRLQPELYGDDTILTPKQEEAALILSRACTSAIPVYIQTIRSHTQLVLLTEFSQRFLAPHLRSRGEINISAGDNRSKVRFSMNRGIFRIGAGWCQFIKDNNIKEGHICAFTFEEEEDGPFSVRVHKFNGMPGLQEKDKEKQRRTEGYQALSFWENVVIKETASLHIQRSPFVRLVNEIMERQSIELFLHEALLDLHKLAVDHLVKLYELVNQLAIRITRADCDFYFVATPYYGDDTSLTPEQEQAAVLLSCGCASGIRTYIYSIKQHDVTHCIFGFNKEFSERYLSPHLGSVKLATDVFVGGELTPFKVNFYMAKTQRATIGGGWIYVIRKCGIKSGDVCAFTFEKEEESAPLSVRVHILH
ncbi:hypothetical protein EJB05_40529, partial [Eragrostis curvula]